MRPDGVGLLLLTGGRGNRMGTPKHGLAHPEGGTWGGHLVRTFACLWPEGPLLLLGEPLPDHPHLPVFEDPRQGPAVALRLWCAAPAPPAHRWWVVACDLVRWTPAGLAAWAERVEAADPGAEHWVMAEHGGHLQPLGGFLPGRLRPALASAQGASLHALARGVPHLVLPAEGGEWLDLDTPADRRAFEAEP